MDFRETYFKNAAGLKLREHKVTLRGWRVALRPMTEDDWPLVEKWETDPDVFYWADGENITSRPPEEVRAIFRTVSQKAYCFIIEHEGRPVGDGWLQEMNLPVILGKFPGKDCRRVDLVIGEKELWGKGLGTEVISVLTKFAFEQEKADMVFGLPGDYNMRSCRAFKKVGYAKVMRMPEPPGSKARYTCGFAMTKEMFTG
jgi:RimJ/RimL family protein N-acetyltransferase